jgi:hypothetical protein
MKNQKNPIHKLSKLTIIFLVLAALMIMDTIVLVGIIRKPAAPIPPDDAAPTPAVTLIADNIGEPLTTPEAETTAEPEPTPEPTLIPIEREYPEGYVPIDSIDIFNRGQSIGDDSFVFLSNRTESKLAGKLMAIIEPNNATNQMITWTSGNEDIVTVSDTGVLTGVGNGIAYVTATADEASTSIRVLVEKTYDPESFWETRFLIGYQHPIHSIASIATVASVGGDYWCNSERHENALDKASTARSHAGVDLNVPAGTNIYAMFSGTVESAAKDGFYAGTGHITIVHDDGTTIRYGEVTPAVTSGRVEKDQLIAVVAENEYGSASRYRGVYNYEHMLHIEVYFGFDPNGNIMKGALSDKSITTYYYAPLPRHGATFNRRADLVDPTDIVSLPRGD